MEGGLDRETIRSASDVESHHARQQENREQNTKPVIHHLQSSSSQDSTVSSFTVDVLKL